MPRVYFLPKPMTELEQLAWSWGLSRSFGERPKPTQEELDANPFTRAWGRPCPEPSPRRLVD